MDFSGDRNRFAGDAQQKGSLKVTVLSSSVAMVLAQGVQSALNVGSVAALARILSPEDFGVIAMVTTIMGLLRVFSDGGLSAATVQSERVTARQISNLFWINVALGGFGTVLVVAAAPLVASFYREPRVYAVTLVLSASFVVAAATVQHVAMIKRQMRFHVLAGIQLVSALIGTVTGLLMAWLNWGYWALVGMQLSGVLTTCLLSWTLSPWRPELPTRNSGIRPLLRFGANLSVSSLVFSLARATDGLLIGRFIGSSGLGLYSRAAALMMRPIDQLLLPIEAVFVPALARVQGEPDRYREMFMRAYRLIALAFFILTAVLLPLSGPITLIVLGEKWKAASPIFASFTLLALYTPIASTASWLLTSQGRGRDFLTCTLTGSLTAVAAFALGLHGGPAGVAFCYSATCLVVNLPVVLFVAGRTGPVRCDALWQSFLQHIPVWLVVYMATALVGAAVSDNGPAMQLIVGGCTGVTAAALLVYFYGPARRTALSAVDVLREWNRGRSSPRHSPATAISG